MAENVTSSQQAHSAETSLSQHPRSTRSPATYRMSISEMTTYRWTFPEDVVEYCQAGIEAIGIWRPKLAQFGEGRGIELIQDSGLSVSSVSWAGGFTGSNGHSYQEALEDAEDALRVAGAMKADCLVTVSGSRSGHTSNHACRLMIDALNALGDLAAEQDVVLAVQPIHPLFAREWTFLTTLDETLDVIDRCDHDFVRLAFNAYHLWQEPRLTERIREITPLVALVQLGDWREPPRSDSDRCLPGDGCIPLSDIIAAFTASDYTGMFELDIWSDELWNSDHWRLIQDCLSRFQMLCPR